MYSSPVLGEAHEVRRGVFLMELIIQHPGIKAPAIAEKLQKSLRTTQRYLKVLSDDRRIEFRGATKNGGYYQIMDNKY